MRLLLQLARRRSRLMQRMHMRPPYPDVVVPTDWISPLEYVSTWETERISLFCVRCLSVKFIRNTGPWYRECLSASESTHSGSLRDTAGVLRTYGGVLAGCGGHRTMDWTKNISCTNGCGKSKNAT
ncbi:unnamed protein product [Ectocarpus sp. 8 AP-2014]